MRKRWDKSSEVSGTSKSASVGSASVAGNLVRPNAGISVIARDSQLKGDPVNPVHYQGDYVMRVIEDFKLDFLSGTIVKYLLRAGNKPGDSILQDLNKAKWYLERKIAALAIERSEASRG